MSSSQSEPLVEEEKAATWEVPVTGREVGLRSGRDQFEKFDLKVPSVYEDLSMTGTDSRLMRYAFMKSCVAFTGTDSRFSAMQEVWW